MLGKKNLAFYWGEGGLVSYTPSGVESTSETSVTSRGCCAPRDIKFITSEQNTVIFSSHCETMLTDTHPCTTEVHAVWGTRLSQSVSQTYTVESGRHSI